MIQNELNYQSPVDVPKFKRRRSMLPWWVIGSIWIFIIFLAIMPVAVILGLLKYNFNISLLGLTTNDPLSSIGIFLILLFAFKGVTALGLWTEKKWAVGLARIDAIISIVICCLSMAAPLAGYGHSFSIRLELIILVPYFYKMNSIQNNWLSFDERSEVNESVTASLQ